MYRACIANCLFLLLHFSGVAQSSFRGVVIEDSVSKSPIYQAAVKVLENGTEVAKLTTYFDGAFTYPTKKGKVYEFIVSVAGTKDVSVNVITDKRGVPTPASAYFTMRKDGLRLVGRVKDVISNMPIDKADVILKDVQTREETRFTTNIDGLYNLKLKYETNYRVSIDKRSPGIINRYEDTVFFVSTIGFNIPLDYELDIALQRAKQLTNRTEYAPAPSKPASKPIIEVKAAEAPPKAEEKVVAKPEVKEGTKKEVAPIDNKQTQKAANEVIAVKEEKAPSKTTDYSQVEMPDKPSKEKKKKEKKDSKNDEINEAIKVAKEVEKTKKEEEKALAKNKSKETKEPKEVNVEEKKTEPKKIETKVDKTPAPSPPVNNTPPQKQERVEDKIVEKLEQKIVQKTNETAPPKPSFAVIIYFAKNAAYITDFSKGKLLPVLQQLKANPNVKITLNAHAGKEETDPSNLCLKRLSSIKTHFISNGITADRVAVKNNSNNIPFNDCHITGGCAEQTLILNRRIEVQLVE